MSDSPLPLALKTNFVLGAFIFQVLKNSKLFTDTL